MLCSRAWDTWNFKSGVTKIRDLRGIFDQVANIKNFEVTIMYQTNFSF